VDKNRKYDIKNNGTFGSNRALFINISGYARPVLQWEVKGDY